MFPIGSEGVVAERVPAPKKMRCQTARLQESFVCFLSVFATSLTCHDIVAYSMREIYSLCKPHYYCPKEGGKTSHTVRTGKCVKTS